MKKILILIIGFLIALNVSSQTAISKDSIESIHLRPSGVLKPVLSDGFYQRDTASGFLYNKVLDERTGVAKSDVVSDPSAAFDSLMSESKYANTGIIRTSQALGGNVIAEPLIFTYGFFSAGILINKTLVGMIVKTDKADTCNSVLFKVNISAVDAVYENFNGAILCNMNNDTIATISTDGTFWNTSGKKELFFNSPIPLEANTAYKICLVYSVSSATSPPYITYNGNDSETFDFYNIGVNNGWYGLKKTGVTTVDANMSIIADYFYPTIFLCK